VILFDPNVQIFTVFALHDCEPLFVIGGHSVGQLFTIVLCYCIFELINLIPYQVAPIVVNGHCTLDVGVTGDEIVEFLVYVVAPAVCLESISTCFLVQSLVLVLLDVEHLSWKGLYFFRLGYVVWEGEDLNLLSFLNVNI